MGLYVVGGHVIIDVLVIPDDVQPIQLSVSARAPEDHVQIISREPTRQPKPFVCICSVAAQMCLDAPDTRFVVFPMAPEMVRKLRPISDNDFRHAVGEDLLAGPSDMTLDKRR